MGKCHLTAKWSLSEIKLAIQGGYAEDRGHVQVEENREQWPGPLVNLLYGGATLA